MGTGAAIPAVELDHVTKNYGSVQALKGISLTIEPGEVVAVLGPNGAGKSTSIALMLGMRRPSSGSVMLFGENPRLANHRKRIGVMLQESGVPETLKVRELVELFGRFHDNPMVTQEAITIAGLEEKASTRLSRLSGRQKQRVYFALALVGNPDVLFLDEPTTGLDVEARRNFWDQINIQVTRSKTILLTTHNLEEADALEKRIIVINQGEIVIDGTPDEIKGHVGGKHVRFHASNLSIEDLQAIAEVQSVQLVNKKFEIYTKQPEAILVTLFKDGADLSDLEVEGARLEEAFLALTGNGHHYAADAFTLSRNQVPGHHHHRYSLPATALRCRGSQRERASEPDDLGRVAGHDGCWDDPLEFDRDLPGLRWFSQPDQCTRDAPGPAVLVRLRPLCAAIDYAVCGAEYRSVPAHVPAGPARLDHSRQFVSG
jgi:ABC-2 type transport system ATP-binding protein